MQTKLKSRVLYRYGYKYRYKFSSALKQVQLLLHIKKGRNLEIIYGYQPQMKLVQHKRQGHKHREMESPSNKKHTHTLPIPKLENEEFKEYYSNSLCLCVYFWAKRLHLCINYDHNSNSCFKYQKYDRKNKDVHLNLIKIITAHMKRWLKI